MSVEIGDIQCRQCWLLLCFKPVQVTSVIRRREQWLQCAAVRFLRTCVGGKDDFFVNLLTKNNVFEPIMTAFFQNGDRYNLLNSTTLELIDFICKENVKVQGCPNCWAVGSLHSRLHARFIRKMQQLQTGRVCLEQCSGTILWSASCLCCSTTSFCFSKRMQVSILCRSCPFVVVAGAVLFVH